MFSCARALAEVNDKTFSFIRTCPTNELCLAWQILLFLLATTETGDWGTVWAGTAFNQIQVYFEHCYPHISML